MKLKTETERLWAAYLVAERGRVREITHPALVRFLDALLSEEPAAWKGWARDLARKVADDGAAFPIRLPLFRRALLPALAEAISNGEAGAARWLAGFDQILHHAADSLPPGLCSAEGLLREALRLDPDDQRARRKLVERLASYLDYTLHELPCGVLWDHDGATAEQCTELLELLAEFRSHTERLEEAATYAELVANCELHYSAYRSYLVDGRPGESYEAYLQSRPARPG